MQSDEIGNITNDGTWTYTWKNGRQLAAMENDSERWDFSYDASGMRTQRSNGNTTYKYTYEGTTLTQMTVGSNTLIFAYGSNGHPMGVRYNGTDYNYVTNAFGDVLAIVDNSGNELVTYTYDAWGNILSTGGSMATTLGAHNPLRYRGYVYDQETGLYYLQSRYYNPNICRFISADSFVSTGQGVLGYNMFVYCNNNPVNYVDRQGANPYTVATWTNTMWWLCLVDTLLPVGDIIYVAGILVLGIYALSAANDVELPSISPGGDGNNKNGKKTNPEPEKPDVVYPGDDPTKAPDGYEWRGKGTQGSKAGNYYNPNKGTSLHPDLNHPDPIGPHWDYYDATGKWWRIFPDNRIVPK